MSGASSQPRVLIVEDEWIIAEAIRDALEAAGFAVTGPAARVEDALQLVEQKRLDVALLDVSLRGKVSFPIASALAARSVPFIFMTGYVSNDFPSEFKDRPILNKPVDNATLVRSLHRLLSEDTATLL